MSLNKLSAINCCPEQKPTRAKKSGKIAPDVLWNTEPTVDAKMLKAKSINDSDNVTMVIWRISNLW